MGFLYFVPFVPEVALFGKCVVAFVLGTVVAMVVDPVEVVREANFHTVIRTGTLWVALVGLVPGSVTSLEEHEALEVLHSDDPVSHHLLRHFVHSAQVDPRNPKY